MMLPDAFLVSPPPATTDEVVTSSAEITLSASILSEDVTAMSVEEHVVSQTQEEE